MRKLTGLMLATVCVLGACSSKGKAAVQTGHTVHMKAILTSSPFNIGGATQQDCHGLHGYDDFSPGMSVTVKDGTGGIIGAGRLANDVAANGDLVGLVQCPLVGSVDVKDAEFYVVTLGKRGDQTFTQADMDKSGYSVTLQLGS
jgi:hypothetical protein